MMKKTLCSVLLACLYFANPAEAQTQDSSTVIIFNSGSSKTSKSRQSSESNIIKVSPLAFIAGKIPLTFERRISDFLSIQVSAGATLRNYSRSVWQESLRESGTTDDFEYTSQALPEGVEDQTDPLYNYDNRKATTGYMLSVQPRLYFASEGLEGGFVGISADVYKYNFTIAGMTEKDGQLQHFGTQKKEHENIRDIMVHYGVQKLFDNLSVEYSLGVGLRNVSGVKYVAGNDDTNFYEGENKYSKNDLNFNVGFKVGYHF